MAATAVLAGLLAACGASLNSGAEGTEPKLGAASVVGETDAVPKLGKSTAARKGSDEADPSRSAVAKSATTFLAASAPGNTAYQVGPQDVIEISVFQVPELAKATQVSDAGTVNLPLVGEIPAAGRTAQDIERDLTKRLKAKYLQNPQVTVFVREFNSQRITVEGAVKKQGVFPLRGKTSLLQALAMAEGLEEKADTTVVVFRNTDQGRQAARFDVSQIRNGSAADPQVLAGDTVVVGSSFWKEQYGNFVKLLPLIGVFALL